MRLARSPLALTMDAILEAVADAGLTLAQIDGVSTIGQDGPSRFSPVGVDEVIEACGLHTAGTPARPIDCATGRDRRRRGGGEGRLARHVICFRTVYEAAALARPEEFRRSNGAAG